MLKTCSTCGVYKGSVQQVAVHLANAHNRTYPIGEIEHGTTAGYQAHGRRGEVACTKCRTAWREYHAKKRSRSGK